MPCHQPENVVEGENPIAEDEIQIVEKTPEEVKADEEKLLCTLETAMYRAMREKQYSAVASNAKVLMKLVGLEAKIKS